METNGKENFVVKFIRVKTGRKIAVIFLTRVTAIVMKVKIKEVINRECQPATN